MKTTKQNIDKELEELNAIFLLSYNKSETEIPEDLEAQVLNKIQNINKISKPTIVKKISWLISGIAASLIIGIFIFNQTISEHNTPQFSWDNVNEEEILIYIEDDLTNYTEEDLFALVKTENSENIFDNSGITEEFLEEYIFNQLNEEIQLEDLL